MRNHVFLVLALLAVPVGAAERKFDFGEVGEGKTPPGFRSAVTGHGKPARGLTAPVPLCPGDVPLPLTFSWHE